MVAVFYRGKRCIIIFEEARGAGLSQGSSPAKTGFGISKLGRLVEEMSKAVEDTTPTPGSHFSLSPTIQVIMGLTGNASDDDDDYDVVSNPDDLSQGTNPTTLKTANLLVWEPQPCPASSQKFPASRWTTAEIQDYIHKVAGERSIGFEQKTVRVYVDGLFDPLTLSHALQLRQAKLSFPRVQLVVGVFSDKSIREHQHEPTWPEEERYELLRHCRWVDEVITEAPWELHGDFLCQRRIDFVAIEEGASVNPAYDKLRVRGYDEVKRAGKAVPTRRCAAVQSASGLRRASPTCSSSVPPSPLEDFTGHMGCAL